MIHTTENIPQVTIDKSRQIPQCKFGGGGYGEVGLRDPALVRADVEAGMVSQERALEVYGVRVDPAAAAE